MIKLKHILSEITIRQHNVFDDIMDHFGINEKSDVLCKFKPNLCFKIRHGKEYLWSEEWRTLYSGQIPGVTMTRNPMGRWEALVITPDFDINNLKRVVTPPGMKHDYHEEQTLETLIWELIGA